MITSCVRARTVSSAKRTNGQRGRNSRNQIHLAGSGRDVSLPHGYLTERNRDDERRGSTLVRERRLVSSMEIVFDAQLRL